MVKYSPKTNRRNIRRMLGTPNAGHEQSAAHSGNKPGPLGPSVSAEAINGDTDLQAVLEMENHLHEAEFLQDRFRE